MEKEERNEGEEKKSVDPVEEAQRGGMGVLARIKHKRERKWAAIRPEDRVAENELGDF